MSPPSNNLSDNGAQSTPRDPNPPTVAPFSPTTIAGSSLTSRQRSSVIVHRKSPLLVATPPTVTRALAHSHPFLLPLNKLVSLLTWSSGDSWASFLLVAGFWAIVLYSDAIILYAGPILVVTTLILGMYSRRYSPLSSTGVTGEKHGHKKQPSQQLSARHQKSLDDIVETMREFTTRCNILLEPFLEMTDFLSTQSTATSATTRPALTSLLIRIICITPIWILLTLPPFYIITTRRVVLTVGTIILTYHSSPARVFRVILWRSLAIRRICSFLTGLSFSVESKQGSVKEKSTARSKSYATAIAASSKGDGGVRFTFIVYENQRRWLGIGWTYSLFPHERSAWTDEHLNSVPPRDNFELPDAKDGNAEWRWVEGSEWRIEGGDDSSDGGGWIYYDNKWQDGRRGQDSWSKYTRRRKWYRDAELVEVEGMANEMTNDAASITGSTASVRKRRWFGNSKNTSTSPSSVSVNSVNQDKPALEKVASASATSRPVSIQHSRTTSFNKSAGYSSSPGQQSTASSLRRTLSSGGDSQSMREREIEDSQNRHDRWATRASGGTERVEREFGLGDDVNMGLS
ncbi:integral peroxisomal membrane peroxin-domain-containing protein [Talaromyces proteolyticus]|uniref:Integral peroxisomal membrane peroxin-domain-containing protein n=1 Tax=Talaromyces proteolyticus TaxID=1131652 RepID=A0AAD4PSF2_9EURO|nr:integral peroxisomal membrane peroxin-domain-containing protein [Talaromyces proteolyticus]KAH8691146.1 integral peroxisomal membrane peroxin-domain-containing protein [Talaromyces proteolyticus]